MRRRALFIRTDKIGDLVSTLPVDQSEICDDLDVTWIIQKGCEFVVDYSEPKRRYMAISKNREGLLALRDFLRENQFDLAVSFNASAGVHWLLWQARIPVRAGVLSQWHSFLFLNRGLRQKRSQAEMHEADYNFELVKHALHRNTDEATPILKMHAPELPELLTQFSLKSKTYIVVHPGMAGSALNWSIEQYVAQIKILLPSFPIVVTGTAMDRKWTQGLKQEFRQGELCFLDEQLDPGQLLYILAHAKHVICPSTGIAHLAASLGTPVTGIYSPIRVHLSRRWGPRGQSDIRILAPNVTCPEAHQCAGKVCSYYNCMDGVAAVHTLDVKSAQG